MEIPNTILSSKATTIREAADISFTRLILNKLIIAIIKGLTSMF
jgi:hypothetical protein